MRIAKADKEDIHSLMDYLIRNEKRSGGKHSKFPHGWRRVLMAADVLIDNVCDPTEDVLGYHPSFHQLHVAPEQ